MPDREARPDQRRFISIRSIYPLTDIFRLKHVKYRVNLEISKNVSVKLYIFYCSLFLYLLWVLKRTVSLSTFNLPMLLLDTHLYEKGSVYAHTLPATEWGIQWRGGGGDIIFSTDPVGVGHGRNWSRVV